MTTIHLWYDLNMQESHGPQFENQESVTRPKEEFIPPDFLDMYQISGQDKISQHSFERYVDSKEKYDEKIRELAEDKKQVNYTVDAELDPVVHVDLSNPNLNLKSNPVAFAIADKIYSTSKNNSNYELILNQTNNIIQNGLGSSDPEVVKNSAYIYWRSLLDNTEFTNKILEFIKSGLADSNRDTQLIAAHTIRYLPDKEKLDIINTALDIPNLEIKKKATEAITWLEPTLESDEQEQLLESIKQKILDIVRGGLSTPDEEIDVKIIELISSLDPIQQEEYLKWGLMKNNQKVRLACLDKVISGSFPDYSKFVDLALESNDPYVQYKSIELNEYLTPEERLQVKDKIKDIIEANLDNQNPEEQRIYKNMIFFTLRGKHKELLDKVIKNFGNIAAEPPLYDKYDIDKVHFSRTDFDKNSGAETTLIGGPLKDKVILRHFTPETFIAWQKLYEDANLWDNYGFDYVPIEPILAYHPSPKGMVDVYSGVLDIDYAHWVELGGGFHNELQFDRDKIHNVLKDQKFNHGHEHAWNFCLRFFRDLNGKVMFDKKPRVYLIDFDRAASPPK